MFPNLDTAKGPEAKVSLRSMRMQSSRHEFERHSLPAMDVVAARRCGERLYSTEEFLSWVELVVCSGQAMTTGRFSTRGRGRSRRIDAPPSGTSPTPASLLNRASHCLGTRLSEAVWPCAANPPSSTRQTFGMKERCTWQLSELWSGISGLLLSIWTEPIFLSTFCYTLNPVACSPNSLINGSLMLCLETNPCSPSGGQHSQPKRANSLDNWSMDHPGESGERS
ncbi:hypothetical protein POX_e06698 [Penicillium oxalicum]|uniref:hypothetical protein n=1 Tax=Penicillium oxalicum TaxID=69781 RepID=UPI0020B76050|nr:hypothetical protein POX_e06698 [Penicillium oxalicum]KAI2788677.1 hypothetical protein POX_e06698 [Penicillium oxalicum]